LPKLVQLLLRLTGRTGHGAHSGLPGASDAGGAENAGADPQREPQREPQQSGEIDVQVAIRRMSGLETLYLRSAREFVKELAHTVEDWLAAMPHNPNQAIMQMHTLKGTAALLGAKRLSNEASRLEQLCHAPLTAQACQEQAQPLRSVVRATQEAMQAVIDEMGARLPAAGAPHAQVPSAPALQEALKALIPLLQASDLKVLAVFAQHRAVLKGVGEPQFSQLEDAVQNLQLEQALVLCRALLRGAV